MNWRDLENEKTSDLAEYVRSIKDPDYKELAEAAFVNLTFRFREDLIKKCLALVRKWSGDSDDAIELSNRVFERYFKYPNGYKRDVCKYDDDDKCFRFYLYGIANRELIRLFSPSLSPYDGTETIVYGIVNPDVDYEPERLRELQEYDRRLDEIFSKLTKKHKIIYLTYKTYEKPPNPLPRELLTDLREALGGISQNTLRVYKKEAMELVNQELNRDAKINVHINEGNMAEWLHSSGYYLPRNEKELLRFEKLQEGLEIIVDVSKVDPFAILSGTWISSVAVVSMSPSIEEDVNELRMAARKHTEIPDEIFQKIRRNQQQDDISDKTEDEGGDN